MNMRGGRRLRNTARHDIHRLPRKTVPDTAAAPSQLHSPSRFAARGAFGLGAVRFAAAAAVVASAAGRVAG